MQLIHLWQYSSNSSCGKAELWMKQGTAGNEKQSGIMTSSLHGMHVSCDCETKLVQMGLRASEV
jgi:hypothetical protein